MSSTKHVVLEKIRITLCLFRKSRVWLESFKEGNSILTSLDTLRSELRGCEECTDAARVLSPFLSVLRVPQLSGPFITLALDAIHTFISCNIIGRCCDRKIDTLGDVVDAVARCRFVHTDATGDQLVQLKIVQVLQDIIRSPLRYYLSDESAWDIVDASFTLLLHLGSKKMKSALYQLTEQTLLDTVRFVFAVPHRPIENGSSPSSPPPCEGEGTVEHACFGMPCAMKIMGHFVNVLEKFVSDDTSNAGSRVASKSTPDGKGRPSLLQIEQSEQELIISLKTLHAILWSDGNIGNSRDIILRCPPMASFVRDDLGRCLVLLTTKHTYSPAVIQYILGLFSTLYASFGPVLKVLMECFSLHVFLKSLHQLNTQLEKMDEIQSGVRENRATPPPGGLTAGPSGRTKYSIEELEMIFDFLLDFVAMPGFLPSLYASFDCDAGKPDVVKPLFQYLGKCSSYALSTPDDGRTSNRHALGPLKNAAGIVVQCLLQVAETIGCRCADLSASTARVNMWHTHRSKYADILMCADKYSPDAVSAQLRADIMTKMLLREAATKFVEKPKLAFQFLQSHGALDNPLTAFSVAKFLRICPGLPKDVVGSFLGDEGRDKPTFEWERKDFHKDVLRHYVKSFELANQGILNCMRIFLSAFRLPGEAQQIDRILVSFSEHCHAQCLEGQSGLLENAEVTYLLTFSIIMLNTDRHNPNVRADRKMTLEQFIRYNTNYGSDVNQTRDLPRDFLESIYSQISDHPLRTEKNDVSGTLTVEMWMDLQLQTHINNSHGFLITTSFPPEVLHHFRTCTSLDSNPDSPLPDSGETVDLAAANGSRKSKSSAQNRRPSLVNAYENTYYLLTSESHKNPLDISGCIYESHWVVDAGLVDCLWMPIISAAMSPFIRQELPTPPSSSPDRKQPRLLRPCASKADIDTGRDLFLLAAKICHSHNLSTVVNAVVMLLSDFAGLAKGDMIDAMVKTLMPLGPLSIELNAGIAHLHEGIPLVEKIPNNMVLEKKVDSSHDSLTYRVSTEFLTGLMTFPPAMTALQCLMRIAVRSPHYLDATGWSTVWHALGIMRDVTALPAGMVCGEDMAGDLLHPKAREEFEYRMAMSRAQELANQREASLLAQLKLLTKSSVLSFQGIGEALFGSSESSGAMSETEILLRRELKMKTTHEGVQSMESGRWNAGYPHDSESAQDFINNVNYIEFCPPPIPVDVVEEEGYDDYIQHLGRLTILQLRKLMVEVNIEQIISDSKFLTENCVVLFFKELCTAAERTVVSGERGSIDLTQHDSTRKRDASASSENNDQEKDLVISDGARGIKDLEGFVQQVLGSFPPPTEASSAWLEMVLVEAALRNRDRMTAIWNIIAQHYVRAFSMDEEMCGLNTSDSNSSDGEKQVILVHSIDRRVLGIFKIATRMLSRPQLCGRIINLLSTLFGERANSGQELKSSTCNTANAVRSTRDMILMEISGQIASGMWVMLTQNVLVLPNLHLDQWQGLFDVIAVAARGGAFAAMKSFECMAWLIHEPSLRAEVPVFCVQAVRPLLSNQNAPRTVATGAIRLLLHLHSRLDVLVKDGRDPPAGSDCEDTPALWESCWVPILRAVCEGVRDGRRDVRSCAVDALCIAITDRHASAVPAEVLANILLNLVIPAAKWLGQDLVQSVRDGTWSSSQDEQPSEFAAANSEDSSIISSSRISITSRIHHTLATVFVAQMASLVEQPQIEELWKSLLNVYAFYLDAPPPLGAGFDSKLCKVCPELTNAVREAIEILNQVIKAVDNGGYFSAATRKGKLWVVTRQATGNLDRCPDLLQTLFPSTDISSTGNTGIARS